MKFFQPEYMHYAFDSHKRGRIKEMFNDDSLIKHYVDNHAIYFEKYGTNRSRLQPNNKYGKSSMEIHQYLKINDGENYLSYDVYLVYEAIEDGNESNMFNANYKKALEWFPYDCENFIIFPPSFHADPND